MGNTFPTNGADALTRMYEDGVGNYWFYHKVTYPADEPLLYKRLISEARSYVEIWDPYFNVGPNQTDADVFDNIANDITIKLLTSKGMVSNSTYLIDVKSALKAKISPTLNVRFGIRVLDKGTQQHRDWLFHDRLLIIDQKDVYIIGSSVGYHTTAQLSTGIYKVENPDTNLFIQSVFATYWANAGTHQLPITFLHP